MENIHIPVLLQEAINALKIKPDGVYIDATFGFGGHGQEILKKLNKRGKLIGLDLDKETYDKAKNLYKQHKNLFLYNRGFFDVDSFDLDKVDGILFDLGVNLYQIKESGRGLSFLKNEFLDMRLDQGNKLTAAHILNTYSKERLEDILKKVDERFFHQIARSIIEERKRELIKTTEQLVDIVRKVKRQKGKINPATLTFMALRIEVNKEHENISKTLEKSVKLLKAGSRIVIITFHSGEDRLVKRFFQEKKAQGKINLINKKVIVPTRLEVLSNPMSRSAKMRVVEKI